MATLWAPVTACTAPLLCGRAPPGGPLRRPAAPARQHHRRRPPLSSHQPLQRGSTTAYWKQNTPVLASSEARESSEVSDAARSPWYSEEVTVEAGKLVIRPATEDDIGGAGVVLTRAFAGTPEGQNLSDISGYISKLMRQFPAAVMLVARLVPNDPALLPPNQQSRVVGTVSLSLSPATRDRFDTLQPEDSCCYLSNMAVDGKLRRQGIASALLSASDKLVKENAKMGGIQLHVRLNDEAAKRLYSKRGYHIVGEDGFLVKLRGGSQRALMAKDL